MTLRAPFPWFGGKSRVASIVWERFGDVRNYVEPFAGSLAVLLARPHAPKVETVNDRDAYLSNFWRAVQHAPHDVAQWANWPVSEADLHARHVWLIAQCNFRERMLTEPDYYDAKIAGWWAWGLSAWLGSGWCDTAVAPSRKIPAVSDNGKGVHSDAMHPVRQLPHMSTSGQGVHSPSRQLPFVGNAGRGVCRPPPRLPSRQLPEMRAAKGVHGAEIGGSFDEYFVQLAARLRRVRVCCGDWGRVVTDSVTVHVAPVTGVLLDPPYADGNVDYAAGGVGTSLSAAVRQWAVQHGDDARFRIALCGYEGEHDMPPSWDCVAWKAKGGYANTRKDGSNDNARRERVWFSPHCQAHRQTSLFDQHHGGNMGTDIKRERRNQGELDAAIIEHLRTQPADTSVRALGAVVGIPAGTAQAALLRLQRDGKIEQAGKNGRATLWRLAAVQDAA